MNVARGTARQPFPTIAARGALVVLTAMAVSAALGAPAVERVPLTLAAVLFVPGVAVLAPWRLERDAESFVLCVGLSLSLSLLLAQVLVWTHLLSTTSAVVAMVAVFAPPLAFAARSREGVRA